MDGKIPVKCDDLITWERWFETADRVVGKTFIGRLVVSTVFLGIDHSFGLGEPILFETMVFEGHGEYQKRYSTWEEAEEGHRRIVREIINKKDGAASTGNKHEKH